MSKPTEKLSPVGAKTNKQKQRVKKNKPKTELTCKLIHPKALRPEIINLLHILGYFSLLKSTVCTRIVELWFLSLHKEDNSNVKREEPKLGMTNRWSPNQPWNPDIGSHAQESQQYVL